MQEIIRLLDEKQLLKVISGINNYDRAKVRQVVQSAQIAGADIVDICDDEKIITEISATFEILFCETDGFNGSLFGHE